MTQGRITSLRCGFTFRDQSCNEYGPHLCVPRVVKVTGFFETILVHTKGRYARKPFILAPWQKDEILTPLFGVVEWDDEHGLYRRRYSIAWLEVARKNGKSELDAGVALYLTCADDEEGAEIYGCAGDRDQARKVYDVAERMVQLSPVLSKRLTVKSHAKRIIDERSGSYYEVIASDVGGNLGHNPHGIVFDEVLTQKDGGLWHALRTGMGARVQPLMLASTTAGNDPATFAAQQSQEMVRVSEDPDRAPHVFTYLRNTPKDADPWDEANWHYANPALGDFLSIKALRDEALEARNDPAKENAFRQFRLNQWVQQTTRWISLHIWDGCNGPLGKWDVSYQTIVRDKLKGAKAFAGLDLASTTDLASWSLWFPDTGHVLWRFWTPEAQIPFLDKHTGDRASVWVRQGWLTATPGDWIDYQSIHESIDQDTNEFDVLMVGYDQKEATATAQYMQGIELDISPVYQGFALSGSLKELMRLLKAGSFIHGGNPVARWNADSAEIKRNDEDKIKIVKPERQASGKRIDGIVALANAINVWQWWEDRSAIPLEGSLMA